MLLTITCIVYINIPLGIHYAKQRETFKLNEKKIVRHEENYAKQSKVNSFR